MPVHKHNVDITGAPKSFIQSKYETYFPRKAMHSCVLI